jgi:anti-sigma regulatory factor (Ser/Thr protein kinase)
MGTEGPTILLDPLWQGLPAHDAETLSGSASCALPCRHEAVRSARQFTLRTLQRWETTRDLDEIALVVSELVTNALRHGMHSEAADGNDADAEPAESGGRHPSSQPIRLQLMRWSARLVCAVRDPGQEFAEPDAAPGCPGAASESGRGLFLVESFSDCWGWHQLTGSRPGKVVWAMFRFTPRCHGPAGGRPRSRNAGHGTLPPSAF